MRIVFAALAAASHLEAEPQKIECLFLSVYRDITSVWEKKRQAFETMAAQEHLWEYYTRVALQRGAQAARNSEKNIQYGEGYMRVFPQVTDVLA